MPTTIDGAGNVNGVQIALASQAQAEAGTDANTLMTPQRVGQAARPVLGTPVASTSGTTIEFTGIPSWAKRVTLLLSNVSTSGTSLMQVQLGTSGGFLTSGYTSYGGVYSTGSVSAISSTGFVQYDNSRTAVSNVFGQYVFTLVGGNSWICSALLADNDNAVASLYQIGGGVTLSGTLDRIRITTVNGTDTFDAGSINIMWE